MQKPRGRGSRRDRTETAKESLAGDESRKEGKGQTTQGLKEMSDSE